MLNCTQLELQLELKLELKLDSWNTTVKGILQS